MSRDSTVVIGAGIIGVTTALELRERGFDVLLIDRKSPGEETSYGNAGVLSASTVLTVNNPGIWWQLPRLALNRSPYFRYDPSFLRSHWRWLAAFLSFATMSRTVPRARALRELQTVSLGKHQGLINRANAAHLLNSDGWLKVFRSRAGFRTSRRERALLRRLDVPFSILSAEALADFEPSLRAIFHTGLLLPDVCSVRDPHALLRSYFSLYSASGGQFVRGNVVGLRQHSDGSWSVDLAGSGPARCARLVIAAGPWASELCGMLDYRIPMAWERGYHVDVEAPDPQLGRPVLDVESGVVMSPQGTALRITCGVELAHRDARPNHVLIRRALAAARTAVRIGRESSGRPWLGSRPTLPDSLPMIGAATRHGGLWFNFGHQHIGLSTSTGSAELLADRIEGIAQCAIDPEPFAPGRFPI